MEAHSQPIATRIPAEILTQIIDWLNPENGDRHFSGWIELPWRYTHVCRYWRQVLIAAPRLWTTIDIGTGDRYGKKEKHLFEHPRVALQLDRTDTQPLFVTTKMDSDFDPKVLELIVQHHRRWKEVELGFYSSDMNKVLGLRDSWSFDELVRLRLRTDSAYHISTQTPDMFMQAPKLEMLHLTHIKLNTLHFPWSQLTSLCLTYVYVDMNHILQVFSQCTSLLDLEIDSVNVEDEMPLGPNTSTTVPRLETLSYEASDQDGELLRFLRMPSLQALTLTTGAPLQEIQSCFQLSRPPLTVLQFFMTYWLEDRPEDDAATLADILQMVPTLEYLGMDFPRQGEPEDQEELDILLTLLDYRGPNQLCPKLSSLVLRQASFSDRSAELFVKMLASRSIITLEENLAMVQTIQETLVRLTEDMSNLEEARSALREWHQRDMDTRGLKSTLRDLTVTFEGNKSKEECFSEAQLKEMKMLTAGLVRLKLGDL